MQSIGTYAVPLPRSQYANINSLFMQSSPWLYCRGAGTKPSGLLGKFVPSPLRSIPSPPLAMSRLSGDGAPFLRFLTRFLSLHSSCPFGNRQPYLAAVALPEINGPIFPIASVLSCISVPQHRYTSIPPNALIILK